VEIQSDCLISGPHQFSGLHSYEKTYVKIDGACKQAARDDLEYLWMDTCCIKAIRSMYA